MKRTTTTLLSALMVALAVVALSSVAPSSADPGLLGDANGDGGTDMVDAMWVAKYAVGLGPTPFDSAAADVDGDADADMVDAMFIAKWCVGLSVDYPIGEEMAPAETPTSLEIEPASFTLGSGQTLELTATLTDNVGNPLTDKEITWSATLGSVDPADGYSTTYTAPEVDTETTVTVTAEFAGDTEYAPSSAESAGTITPNEPPVANFSWTPAEPTDLENVYFTDESTDADGEIASWSWDFGDGATSDIQSPKHQYADDGTYTVILTVTDDNDATDSVSKEITVLNVAPTADFSWTPTTQMVMENVLFEDLSTDPDGSVVSWSWNFGDEATSEDQNPTHQYADDGIYTVTLTVTDDDDAIGSVSKDITVVGLFEMEGNGTAEWTSEQAHTGSYSAKLSVEGGVANAARVVIPYGDTLSSIGNISYWFNIKTATIHFTELSNEQFWYDGNARDGYIAPYITLELDTTGDGIKDNWLILFHYGEDRTGEWVQRSIAEGFHTSKTGATGQSYWHSINSSGLADWEKPSTLTTLPHGTLEQWQGTELGNATVLNVKIAIGEWTHEPLTEVYVDDITILPNCALSFDGVDDYVGQSGVMADTMPVTISLWFKWTGIKSLFDTLAGSRDKATLRAVTLRINSGTTDKPFGTYNWSCFSTKTRDTGLKGVGSAPTGTWTHLVAVAEPADGEDVHYLLYQDGELVAETIDKWPAPSECPIWIGTNYDLKPTTERYFNGSIDDVRVYNRALSAGEVGDLYNGNPVSDDNLLAWWKFDEGSGTIAYDSSGNNNDGTIHGATWVERLD